MATKSRNYVKRYVAALDISGDNIKLLRVQIIMETSLAIHLITTFKFFNNNQWHKPWRKKSRKDLFFYFAFVFHICFVISIYCVLLCVAPLILSFKLILVFLLTLVNELKMVIISIQIS